MGKIMRHSPELILRVLGTMDSADDATKQVAFEKARLMLSQNDLTFAGLYETYLAAAQAVQKNPRPAPSSDMEPITENYIKKPFTNVFSRAFQGVKVFRNTPPPTHVLGELRITSEKTYKYCSGIITLTFSFKTASGIYEGFKQEYHEIKNRKTLNSLRKVSAKGIRFQFV